jgi:LEA14-like dessication related protein
MKGFRFVTGAAVAALMAGLVGGCGSLAKPKAEIVGVRIQDLGLKSAVLAFDVEVSNPYPTDLPMVNLDYRLASQGNSFVSGKAADLQGAIPANGKRTIGLPVKIVYTELLAVLKELHLGSVVPYTAEMGLSVNVPLMGDLRLPLKKEGQFPIPAVPDVEVAEIKWDKLSTDEIAGKVHLNLVNRNQFAVDMTKMSYALSLGDVEVARSSLSRATSFAADGGRGSLEIPISIAPQQAGFGVLRMLMGSGSTYSLRGNADFGTPFGPMSLPLEKTGKTLFRR